MTAFLLGFLVGLVVGVAIMTIVAMRLAAIQEREARERRDKVCVRLREEKERTAAFIRELVRDGRLSSIADRRC